jgi:RHH-type proline utilization regulon transcriptional repressor/proline dehydrogenase/delta 1-pyrroline-5-carboxylate dehydrogenase
MKNEKFKTNMFRFVDVLPSLTSGQDVSQHLKEYFTENGGELPPVFTPAMIPLHSIQTYMLIY